MEEDHLAARSQETADRGQDMDTQEADRTNKVLGNLSLIIAKT